MKKIVFIINPASGVFSKENLKDTIGNYLDRKKFDFEIVYTEGPGHATELCKENVGRGVEIITAVGGDGSINEVAKGLIGTDTALGIIPAGSGNGLAHHLNIPVSYRNAIRIINQEKIEKIDTGSINGHFFVSIAGIGFDGVVARKFQKSKLRGFVSYLRIVAEHYAKYKPKKYRVTLKNETITSRALFIVFANSDQFGFRTRIAPKASINDGLLDVVIAEKPQIIELPFLASLMYWHQIEKSKYITVHKTEEVFIQTKRNRWANVDGEPMKLGRELHVKINPLSLNILMP